MRFLFLLFGWYSLGVAAEELCPLAPLPEQEYLSIECQFYLGTTAYRASVYTVAAAHWQYVAEAPLKYEGDDEIKDTASSTLGYLQYHGLGIAQDRETAVSRWKQVVKNGANLEARRHIGFAYADVDYSGYDVAKALAWYQSITAQVTDPASLDEGDLSVYEDTLDAIRELESRMTPRQIKKSRTFANRLDEK